MDLVKGLFKTFHVNYSYQGFIIEIDIKNFNPSYFIKKINENIDPSLSYKTHVRNEMTSWNFFKDDKNFNDVLNNNMNTLNFLNIDKCVLKDAWGTKSKKFVETTLHSHGQDCVTSGILYLTEKGPGTFFPDFNHNVEEKIGKLIFFDSKLNHMVKKTKINETRYLISFNFYKWKFWDN
jgi:hypothetical protein